MKFLLLFLLLTSCSKFKVHDPVLDIPQAFLPYFNSFLLEAKTHGKELFVNDLRVTFVDLSYTGSLAICHTNGYDTPTIVVDFGYWSGTSDNDREELMYHEFGHCVLGRRHLEGEYMNGGNGIPLSIMASLHFDGMTYFLNHEYYMVELFK